jgi:hypothetical protein
MFYMQLATVKQVKVSGRGKLTVINSRILVAEINIHRSTLYLPPNTLLVRICGKKLAFFLPQTAMRTRGLSTLIQTLFVKSTRM